MTDARFHRLTHPDWLARQPRLTWLIPLALYTMLIIPAAWVRRAQINPDAICYIRLSTYLLRGDWGRSFSGYWSPLLPWCMTPFLAAGMDGLWAARLTLALTGAVYVLAAHGFLRRFQVIPDGMRFAILIAAALVAVRLAVKIITPDLLMATVLLGYLTVAHGNGILRPRRALCAGLLAGLAYLAKAYAMPFFLVHFPLTLLLHWRMTRKKSNGAGTNLPAALGAGLAGFLLVAGPWIALLSHSYERLTMGTAGQFNHNNVDPAPPEVQHRLTFFVPPDPYIIENEIKDRRMTGSWSPLDSRDHLRRQWAVAARNAPRILAAIVGFDGAWPGMITLTLVGVLLFVGRREWEGPWLAMTVLVYCSGFAFVYFETRLIEAPMRFPLLLTCVLIVSAASRQIGGAGKARRLRWMPTLVVAGILAIAMADLPGAFRAASRDEMFRATAAAMRDAGIKGPIACRNRGAGGYIGYFLDAKVITIPPTDSQDEFERDCARGGARCLILAAEFPRTEDPHSGDDQAAHGPTWQHRLTLSNTRVRIEVYSR